MYTQILTTGLIGNKPNPTAVATQSALDEAFESAIMARDKAKSICVSIYETKVRRPLDDYTRQYQQLDQAIEQWEALCIKAVSLTTNFAELRQVSRICYRGGKAELSVNERLVQLADT